MIILFDDSILFSLISISSGRTPLSNLKKLYRTVKQSRILYARRH